MLLSGEEVEIVVEFVAIGEALEGSITFPGHEPRVLSNVGFDSRGVHFEISEGGRVIVAYDGELAGDTISGDALEGRESAPFTLKRRGAPGGSQGLGSGYARADGVSNRDASAGGLFRLLRCGAHPSGRCWTGADRDEY